MKRSAVIALLCVVSFASAPLWAQKNSYRSGTADSSFALKYQESISIDYEGNSAVDIGSDYGFGFRFGYNYSSNLNVSFQFDWLSAPYTAYLVPTDEDSSAQQIRHKLDQWGGTVKAVYHLSPNKFTPYIEGGLGWVTIDSNIVAGPPTTGCWWHPWLGYVCDTWQTSYTDSSFSYELGLGLRYELDNRTFLRGSISHKWIDTDFATSQPGFYYAQLEIGAMVWD